MSFFGKPKTDVPVPAPPEPLNAVVKRVAISVFLTLLAAVLTLGVGAIVLSEVWQFVSNLNEFKVDLTSVQTELPRWAMPAIEGDLQRVAGLNGKRSIFEPGLGKRLALAYGRSPWVLKVCYVRRLFPNSLEVGLALRKPAAAVHAGDASYLVDEDGVLLSRRFYRWPGDAGLLPVIVPTHRVAPCSPGIRWREESILAGVGLLRMLREYGIVETLNIRWIDVSNFGGIHDQKKSEIVLCNGTRTRIKWGRFATNKRPGEARDIMKLQNLLTVVKREGCELAGIDYVDVRWNDPYIMRRSDVTHVRSVASR